MKKNNYSFTVYAQNERDYSHFRLVINEPKPYSSTDKRELCTLSWQAGAEARGTWYGFRMEAALSAYDGNVAERAARLAKLLTKLDLNGNDGPEGAIAKLCALGIVRTAYDGRVSRHLSESEAIDATHCRYMDDWSAYGYYESGCHVATVAADPVDAKADLTKRFADEIARGSNTSERFAAWVTAGKPVKRDHYAKPATFEPLSELLNKTAVSLEVAA